MVNALAQSDYLVNGSEVHIDIYDDRMEIYSPGGMPDGSIIQDRDPLHLFHSLFLHAQLKKNRSVIICCLCHLNHPFSPKTVHT